ncbi:MAG: hypothetical protein JWP07_1551, partial [Pseudonocardiales bacterium]|nr:hypothetical protein [Pseudonocardiales bacterium]
ISKVLELAAVAKTSDVVAKLEQMQTAQGQR